MLKKRAKLLAINAVVKEMARHNPVTTIYADGKPPYFCSACWTEAGQVEWPCPTVLNLQAAEEAINEALAYFGPAPDGTI